MKTKNLNETVYFVNLPSYVTDMSRAKVHKGKIFEISHQYWEFDKGNEHKIFYVIRYKNFNRECNSTPINPGRIFKTKKQAEKYICKKLIKNMK